MSIRKLEAKETLSRRPLGDLRAALRAAGKEAPLGWTEAQLAQSLTESLWWSYTTPLGYAADQATFDDMVEHVIQRLRWTDDAPAGTAWERLHWLTRKLVPDGDEVDWDTLDPDVQARLARSLLSSAALSGGGASAAAAGRVGQVIMAFAKTPIGRLLPRIPQIAPAWRTIAGVAGVASWVGIPLGVGLGLLALNLVFGTNYRRFVPTLLAVGLLMDRPLLLPALQRATKVSS